MVFKNPNQDNPNPGCTNFPDLMKYLCQEEKMDWIELQHIGAMEPLEIGRQMELTAERSARCEKPMWHRILSWDPGDHPTQEQMRTVANRFLKTMGLQEHEVAVVAHKDTSKPHIHFVVNRVHPEKLISAWDSWLKKKVNRKQKIIKKEYQRLEEFARAMEKEYGWREVPGRHTQHGKTIKFDGRAPTIWETKRPEEIRKAAAGMGFDLEGADLRPHTLKAKEIKEELFATRSFAEFDEVLARQGLWLKHKGQGAVITDGTDHVAVSKISQSFSMRKLEKRFGEDFKTYLGSREKQIDPKKADRMISRALTDHVINDLQSAQKITKKRYKQIEMELARIQASPEIQSVRRKIEQAFEQTYEDPQVAYEKFAGVASREDFTTAYLRISEYPEEFGKVKDDEQVYKLSETLRQLQSKNQQTRHYIQSLLNKGKLTGQKKQMKKSYLDVSRELSAIKSHSNKALYHILAHSEAGRDLLRLKRGTRKGIRLVSAVISFHRSLQRMAKSPPKGLPASVARSLSGPQSDVALKALEAGIRMVLGQGQKIRSNNLSR